MTENPEKIYPKDYEPQDDIKEPDPKIRNQLLNHIIKHAPEDSVDFDIFSVMANRRSTRKFLDQWVEPSKVDRIIAGADTAPPAGNFQGFEIFYVKDPEKKGITQIKKKFERTCACSLTSSLFSFFNYLMLCIWSHKMKLARNIVNRCGLVERNLRYGKVM